MLHSVQNFVEVYDSDDEFHEEEEAESGFQSEIVSGESHNINVVNEIDIINQLKAAIHSVQNFVEVYDSDDEFHEEEEAESGFQSEIVSGESHNINVVNEIDIINQLKAAINGENIQDGKAVQVKIRRHYAFTDVCKRFK